MFRAISANNTPLANHEVINDSASLRFPLLQPTHGGRATAGAWRRCDLSSLRATRNTALISKPQEKLTEKIRFNPCFYINVTLVINVVFSQSVLCTQRLCVHACVCVCVLACVRMCEFVCVCVYIEYINKHTHTQTHTHTRTRTRTRTRAHTHTHTHTHTQHNTLPPILRA